MIISRVKELVAELGRVSTAMAPLPRYVYDFEIPQNQRKSKQGVLTASFLVKKVSFLATNAMEKVIP